MVDSKFIFDITVDNFSSVVIEKSHKIPVLVDFWADWCQPCHSLMPVLAKLVDQYNGAFILAKINADDHKELAAQFGVRSLPTVKVFKYGEVVDEFMGALPEPELIKFIDKHMLKESDLLRQQAQQAMQQNQLEQARELLLKAEAAAPDDTGVQTDLAILDAREGQVHIALARLEALPYEARQHETIVQLMSRLRFAEIAAESGCINDASEILKNDADNEDALYCSGAKHVLSEQYQLALDNFFHLMKVNRDYKNDAGRKAMLEVFNILGDENDITAEYRRKLFNLLH